MKDEDWRMIGNLSYAEEWPVVSAILSDDREEVNQPIRGQYWPGIDQSESWRQWIVIHQVTCDEAGLDSSESCHVIR